MSGSELAPPPSYPDRPGRWRCDAYDGEDYECDVYPLPFGELCAWCEECGRDGMTESDVWADDEWFGHVPTRCLERDGVFTFLETARALMPRETANDMDYASKAKPTQEPTEQPENSALSASTGSHPRVERVLKIWLTHDAKGLTFGTDAEKAAAWQKAASRLERLARKMEDELFSANDQGES